MRLLILALLGLSFSVPAGAGQYSTPLSLMTPAVARFFGVLFRANENTSPSTHECRLFLEPLVLCVHPSLLSL